MRQINVSRTSAGVVAGDQTRHGHLHEVRIREIARAVLECASQRFDDQVVCGGLAHLTQLEFFEHAQTLGKRDAAGGRQRSGRNASAAVPESHRLALDHLVARQVSAAPYAPGLIDRFHHGLGHAAFIKPGKTEARNALQRNRQFGLLQDKPGGRSTSFIEKALGVRPCLKKGLAQLGDSGISNVDRESFACKTHGRRERDCEWQPAVAFSNVYEPRRQARNCDGRASPDRGAANRPSLLI